MNEKNATHHLKAFGLRVKRLRAEKLMTQEELAESCQLFRTYMSRIESGLANPTLTVIHALADGLGVQVQDLFDEAEASMAVLPLRVNSEKKTSRGRVAR